MDEYFEGIRVFAAHECYIYDSVEPVTLGSEWTGFLGTFTVTRVELDGDYYKVFGVLVR